MNSEEEKDKRVGEVGVHNLKNVDVEIPRNSLTVITGLSGWQVILSLRHHFCRRPATLYRNILCIRPQFPGRHGTS